MASYGRERELTTVGTKKLKQHTKNPPRPEIYLIKLICVSASRLELFPFVFDL